MNIPATALIAAAAYVGTAAVSTMPPKDAEWNWRTFYGWLFDCSHMMLNMRHSPTLPVGPAQPQK